MHTCTCNQGVRNTLEHMDFAPDAGPPVLVHVDKPSSLGSEPSGRELVTAAPREQRWVIKKLNRHPRVKAAGGIELYNVSCVSLYG